MLFSDAIIAGSKKHPQLFDKDYALDALTGAVTATCVLYAALDGIGVLEELLASPKYDGRDADRLAHIWPFPIEALRCPACPQVWNGGVFSMVLHLNDDHRWTRERQAEWVRTQEVTA